MTIRRIAAVVAALGLSLIGWTSHAQVMTGPDYGTYGWYLRAEGGWNHTSDLTGKSGNLAVSATSTEDEGYIAGGAVGYGFGQWRGELNIDYRDNGVKSLQGAGFPVMSASGSVEGTSFMVNGLLDLPWNFSGFQPYAGLGAGFVYLDLASVSSGGVQYVNDAQIVPALQAMLGVRYNLTPEWGVGLEYRFLNGFHPGPYRAAVAMANFNTTDYRNSSILLSITYSFGRPPPPPPPMPAAAPAPAVAPAPQAAPAPGPRQLFLVFFDFDKSNITDSGRQVLDAAVAAYQKDQPIRIEVTGYTDTVGTQKYNLGLSQRRADAVRDYLRSKGVPQDRMDVAWKGKEDLRVPTPDGVREPQNRRVEIVIP